MKAKYPVAAVFVLVALFGAPSRAGDQAKPNIILFISDDHGFSDYGFMGSEDVETPNLDRLAEAGLVYSRGYATPSCASSLAVLLTGDYPHRNGITGNDLKGPILGQDRTPLAERTLQSPLLLPRVLAEHGYLTFQVGKLWNTDHAEVGFTAGTAKGRERSGGRLGQWRGDMAPVRDFLERADRAGKPFFLWAAPYLPHRPHRPPSHLQERYAGRGESKTESDYLAMVAFLDEVYGRLERLLSEFGSGEDTVTIYLADNGFGVDPAHRSGADPRSKHSGYELGVRTPIVVRWPGQLVSGRNDQVPVSIVDVVPTVLAAAGIPAPPSLPGVNLLDAAAAAARGPVFLSVFTVAIQKLTDPVQSLRARIAVEGFWKLMVPGPHAALAEGDPLRPALYDLRQDPGEEVNLARSAPETVSRLQEKLDLWWATVPDRASPDPSGTGEDQRSPAQPVQRSSDRDGTHTFTRP